MSDPVVTIVVVCIFPGLPFLTLLSIPWVYYLTERKRR